MKIAIIGNCQYSGLAKCFTAATGIAGVTGINGDRLRTAPKSLRGPIEACDFVFVQTGKSESLLAAALPASAARAIRFPRIAFNAFHPDMCAVHAGETIVRTPLGDASSRIVIAAYRKGLGVTDTAALFNKHVYRALGYFDWWSGARAALEQQFEGSDIDAGGLFQAWTRSGCFMHSAVHPKLHVLADIACAMARKLGLDLRTTRPDCYVHDALKVASVWPVYPEIAAAYGIEGDYCFKAAGAAGAILSLREFIEGSFAAYAAADDPCIRTLDTDLLAKKMLAPLPAPSRPAPAPPFVRAHPYQHLPDHQHWLKAVAAPAPADIDPVVAPRFTLSAHDRLASVGSCFAQHISQRLNGAGLNYFVTEPAPAGMSAEEAVRRGYGLFSARYGNVYSARQLDQLFARAQGDEQFDEPAWLRADGRLADPFRPSIEPDGFADEDELGESRRRHLAAVRAMMEGLDVLVVTLGLTEAWRSKRTGAVFPSAPGVVAGAWDETAFEFVNFGVDDVVADLTAAFAKVRAVNPRARFIITVSPVPLMATYEPRHVLQSTAYSKAVLRAAADIVCRDDPHAMYFPSYEIVSSPFSRGAYFEPDVRSVTPAGVDHVMRLFLHHLYGRAPVAVPDYEIFCDEASNA